MPELVFSERSERDDLGAFVARAVRLDGQTVVRLRSRDGGVAPALSALPAAAAEAHHQPMIDSWVATPFDVLATRTVRGEVRPADVTVSGNELLAALAVGRGERVDPGRVLDLQWRSALPPDAHWQVVDQLPAKVVADLADRGLAVARDSVGPQGTPPASLLDQTVLTVTGAGLEIKVPLRCLFAMAGMGFIAIGGAGGVDDADNPNDADEQIRVTATDAWLRIDARYGAVVRRRHALLPLLV